MIRTFKKKIVQGDLLIGTILTLPSTEIAEVLSLSGFNWLFVDLEHSAMSIRDAQQILQTATPALPCAIRVPSHDEVWIKKVLDLGPSGIIIPQVKSAEEVQRVIRHCKYSPGGTRSVGIGRAHGFGYQFAEYIATANDETAVIIQIEHIDAVNDIDKILQITGIDCLFVGPYDLSASMGKIGQVDDPEVQEAISLVRKRAQQAHIPLGIFGATVDAVMPSIQGGFTLIAIGLDTVLMGEAAKKITSAF